MPVSRGACENGREGGWGAGENGREGGWCKEETESGACVGGQAGLEDIGGQPAGWCWRPWCGCGQGVDGASVVKASMVRVWSRRGTGWEFRAERGARRGPPHLSGTVVVDAVEKDLARTKRLHRLRQLHGP
eukprot:361335-Chlamydomonas_euryale.AAC.6